MECLPTFVPFFLGVNIGKNLPAQSEHLGIPRMASQVSPSTPPTSPTTEDRGPTPTSRHGTPGRLAYAIMALVVAF